METVALRFSDNYAPENGMIYYHEELINKYNYVWYGKFGRNISKSIISEQLKQDDPKFLLIKSGCVDRYWVHFCDCVFDSCPEPDKIPEYYRNNSNEIKCWFKVTKFEKAPKDILSKCFLISSGDSLSMASKYSMNPYFKIKYNDMEEK